MPNQIEKSNQNMNETQKIMEQLLKQPPTPLKAIPEAKGAQAEAQRSRRLKERDAS